MTSERTSFTSSDEPFTAKTLFKNETLALFTTRVVSLSDELLLNIKWTVMLWDAVKIRILPSLFGVSSK